MKNTQPLTLFLREFSLPGRFYFILCIYYLLFNTEIKSLLKKKKKKLYLCNLYAIQKCELDKAKKCLLEENIEKNIKKMLFRKHKDDIDRD